MRYHLKLTTLLVSLCLACAVGAQPAPPSDQAKVAIEADTSDASLAKVVLIAGSKSHGRGDHEYYAGMTLLMKMLRQTPGVFPVLVVDGWPKNEKILDGAKCIAVFSDGGGGQPFTKGTRAEVIQRYVDKGVGLVHLHYAVDYPKGAAGDRALGWLGGYYEGGYSTNPTWTADFKQLPDHPIARGVSPFRLDDEWYYNMRFVGDMKGVAPILEAVPPDRSRGTPVAKEHPGRAEIVAWAFDRPDGGRSFGFTGGHFHRNWANDDFRRVVTNAILWTAKVEVPKDGAKVDLKPGDMDMTLDAQ